MKFNFTNEEGFRILETLSSLEETGKLGYIIAKNTRKFKDELQEYVQKRTELIQKYGILDESSPGLYTFEGTALEDMTKELQEYSTIQFTLDLTQVDVDCFCSGHLNNQQMLILDWMVEEEEK